MSGETARFTAEIVLSTRGDYVLGDTEWMSGWLESAIEKLRDTGVEVLEVDVVGVTGDLSPTTWTIHDVARFVAERYNNPGLEDVLRLYLSTLVESGFQITRPND